MRITPRPRGRPPAFTLIELLVVVAIIGVLVALLLPAVQAAREAARRTQCFNNLKQIGVGLHNYHGAHGSFPAGGFVVLPAQPQNRGMNTGWSSAILPFVEQRALYNALNLGQPYNVAANSSAASTILQVYLCPSEPRAGYLNTTNDDPFPCADADYGGMYGERILTRNDPPRGLMIFNQCLSIADASDGTSTTIHVGEDPEAINAVWASGHNVFDQAYPINARPPSEYGEELTSRHPGGVNVLLGDGSVRFLRQTITPATTAALCTRNGGEILSASDY